MPLGHLRTPEDQAPDPASCMSQLPLLTWTQGAGADAEMPGGRRDMGGGAALRTWVLPTCVVGHSHPTLCDSMDCSPPGSSVYGILQARILGQRDLPDPGIRPASPALPAVSLSTEPLGIASCDTDFFVGARLSIEELTSNGKVPNSPKGQGRGDQAETQAQARSLGPRPREQKVLLPLAPPRALIVMVISPASESRTKAWPGPQGPWPAGRPGLLFWDSPAGVRRLESVQTVCESTGILGLCPPRPPGPATTSQHKASPRWERLPVRVPVAEVGLGTVCGTPAWGQVPSLQTRPGSWGRQRGPSVPHQHLSFPARRPGRPAGRLPRALTAPGHSAQPLEGTPRSPGP